MKRLLLILTAAACTATTLCAQNTWRGKRRTPVPPSSIAAASAAPMVPCDSSIVSAAGFEKTLRSTNESLFITNHSADTIERVLLHIEYLDTSGRQLHSRREYIGVNLPPASTRKVDIKSFDRQGVFYYHLSGHPRTRANATPFEVRLSVDSISLHKSE